jgi:hypothetical protein
MASDWNRLVAEGNRKRAPRHEVAEFAVPVIALATPFSHFRQSVQRRQQRGTVTASDLRLDLNFIAAKPASGTGI